MRAVDLRTPPPCGIRPEEGPRDCTRAAHPPPRRPRSRRPWTPGERLHHRRPLRDPHRGPHAVPQASARVQARRRGHAWVPAVRPGRPAAHHRPGRPGRPGHRPADARRDDGDRRGPRELLLRRLRTTPTTTRRCSRLRGSATAGPATAPDGRGTTTRTTTGASGPTTTRAKGRRRRPHCRKAGRGANGIKRGRAVVEPRNRSQAGRDTEARAQASRHGGVLPDNSSMRPKRDARPPAVIVWSNLCLSARRRIRRPPLVRI